MRNAWILVLVSLAGCEDSKRARKDDPSPPPPSATHATPSEVASTFAAIAAWMEQYRLEYGMYRREGPGPGMEWPPDQKCAYHTTVGSADDPIPPIVKLSGMDQPTDIWFVTIAGCGDHEYFASNLDPTIRELRRE